MDLIEWFLYVSPDGGSGATELIYLIIALIVVSVVVLRRKLMAAVKSRPVPPTN